MVNSGVCDGRKEGVSGVSTGVSERKQRWGGGQV